MIVYKNVHIVLELDERETAILRGLLGTSKSIADSQELGAYERECERLREALLARLPESR